jgi:hypothetical protein
VGTRATAGPRDWANPSRLPAIAACRAEAAVRFELAQRALRLDGPHERRAPLMEVRCSRCGRGYDVARFAHGRTLDCACGARVGVDPPATPRAAGEPRFLADAMLGRLARWLRILGFDTAYRDDWSDAELARRAFEEDRILLTRDRRLPDRWRVPRVLVLGSEGPGEQLREVARAFPRGASTRAFTRCSRCNAPLEAATRESVAAAVPPRVLRDQREFRRCPGCARVYWEGSHVARMRSVLDDLLRD